MSKYIDFLNSQYDKFRLNLLNTSKINIFSKAEEIYHKSLLLDCIVLKIDNFSNDELLIIYSMENFIDELYVKIKNSSNRFTEKSILNAAHQVIKICIKNAKETKK